MSKCITLLKWTHLTLCSSGALLCVILVFVFTQSIATQVLATIGILCSLSGAFGAYKQNYYSFIVFYFYVFFNTLFGIRTAILDNKYWFYPTICCIITIFTSPFTQYLRRLKNSDSPVPSTAIQLKERDQQ